MEHDLEKKSIIDKVLPWCLDRMETEIWYNNAILPSLGCTAQDLVKRGRYTAVIMYIEAMEEGGFA